MPAARCPTGRSTARCRWRRSTPTASTPAGAGKEITAEELDHSARAALDAGADGLVFYHWTDFLVDEAAGGRKRAVLRGLSGD